MAFDTLLTQKRLIATGMSPEQAEMLVDAARDALQALATQDDLDALRGDLRREMAELRGDLRREMADLRGDLRREMADLRGEMAELRGDLHGEMAELRGDLRGEMAGLRGEMADLRADFARGQTRLIMWMVGVWIGGNAILVAAGTLALGGLGG